MTEPSTSHTRRAADDCLENSTISKQSSAALLVCEVDGSVMRASDVGKCLGYWWKGDLSASRSVEENVQKARQAFFHYGSFGVLWGDISPLSSREVIEFASCQCCSTAPRIGFLQIH